MTNLLRVLDDINPLCHHLYDSVPSLSGDSLTSKVPMTNISRRILILFSYSTIHIKWSNLLTHPKGKQTQFEVCDGQIFCYIISTWCIELEEMFSEPDTSDQIKLYPCVCVCACTWCVLDSQHWPAAVQNQVLTAFFSCSYRSRRTEDGPTMMTDPCLGDGHSKRNKQMSK